jgi:hypothetical protein
MASGSIIEPRSIQNAIEAQPRLEGRGLIKPLRGIHCAAKVKGDLKELKPWEWC